MPPISSDLLLFKGNIDVSVPEVMVSLLLLELKSIVLDRVSPWDVVVPITVSSVWVVNFTVSDVKFWTTVVELDVLLFVEEESDQE